MNNDTCQDSWQRDTYPYVDTDAQRGEKWCPLFAQLTFYTPQILSFYFSYNRTVENLGTSGHNTGKIIANNLKKTCSSNESNNSYIIFYKDMVVTSEHDLAVVPVVVYAVKGFPWV